MWWHSGSRRNICAYFSLFDDWSHDRFNTVENNKKHGWLESKNAVSGIKFYHTLHRPVKRLADKMLHNNYMEVDSNLFKQWLQQIEWSQMRPTQITPRNHFFPFLATPKQACPTWVKVSGEM